MSDEPKRQPDGFVSVVSMGHRMRVTLGFVNPVVGASEEWRSRRIGALRQRLAEAIANTRALEPPIPGVRADEQVLAAAVMVEIIRAVVADQQDVTAALVLAVTLVFEDPNVCITLDAKPDGGAFLGLQVLKGRTFAEVNTEVDGIIAAMKSESGHFSQDGTPQTVH